MLCSLPAFPMDQNLPHASAAVLFAGEGCLGLEGQGWALAVPHVGQ